MGISTQSLCSASNHDTIAVNMTLTTAIAIFDPFATYKTMNM